MLATVVHRTLPLLPLLLISLVPAQVAVCDIGVTGFSMTQFGIATPPTVTGYSTNFMATITSQSILHDPLSPNDFIIGGFGFVGRATILAPSATSYSLITNGIGVATQMSWDFFGNLIVADGNTQQVRAIDAAGTITDLTNGPQPWGTSLNAGSFDLSSGDTILGGNGALYRLPFGATTAVPLASNLGGFVTGITFDRFTGDTIATIGLPVHRLVRCDAAGNVSDIVPPGTVTLMNAIDLDVDGNYLVCGQNGAIHRIQHDGTATLIATNTSPAGTQSGLSIVRDQSSGYASPFGDACDATFGPARLESSGPYRGATPFTTTSIHHQPNAIGLWIIGISNAAPLPLALDALLGTSGCFLHVSGDVALTVLGDAAGRLSFTFTPPLAWSGFRIYLQHMAVEPAVAGGLSFSNGVAIQL